MACAPKVVQNAGSRSTRSKTELPPHEERIMATTLSKTKLCSFWQRGRCTRTQCSFAHGMEELNVTPELTKTTLCRFAADGGVCKKRNCQFAHGEAELRVRQPLRPVEVVTRSTSAAASTPRGSWASLPAAADTFAMHKTLSGGSTASGGSTDGCASPSSRSSQSSACPEAPCPTSAAAQSFGSPQARASEEPSPGSHTAQSFGSPQAFVPEVGFFFVVPVFPVTVAMPVPIAQAPFDSRTMSMQTPAHTDLLSMQREAEAQLLRDAAPEFYED